MRRSVLAYKERSGDLPDLNIVFCGNRAVITARKKDLATREDHYHGHNEIFFGPFFWIRLAFGAAKVYRKQFKK